MAAAHEADKAETVRRVKLAYYDLAYVDRALGLNEQELELLRHYESLSEARYAQGVGLQQAVVKLQAEIARGLNRLETLRLRRVDSEVALNALTDRPAAEPLPRIALATPSVATVRCRNAGRLGETQSARNSGRLPADRGRRKTHSSRPQNNTSRT